MTYHVDDVELVCPTCRCELDESRRAEQLRCTGCGATYPIVAGIPDLRIFPDPYISIRGDHTKGEMLARHSGDMPFAEIVALYFDVTPEVPARDAATNTSRVIGGVSRAQTTLDALQETTGLRDDQLYGRHRWLDVGCGSAPLVAALAQRGVPVVGVDIAFRWLVMGRKRLMDLGLRAPLVAACAEALPFRDGLFDTIAFQSSLEVVTDQAKALGEAFRTSRSGGRALVSTPNKLSIGPDPHVGVYGGGYLPRRVVSVLARLQMVRPPHRRLLSRRGLARALRSAGWQDIEIVLPGVSRSQREQFSGVTRKLADLYETSRTTPVLRTALHVVGPLLQATAVKG